MRAAQQQWTDTVLRVSLRIFLVVADHSDLLITSFHSHIDGRIGIYTQKPQL